MSLPQINEVKNLTNEELSQEILKVKKELFDLKFKKATRQSFKPHKIKHLKHKLAQLLTIEHQKILNTIFSN